MSVEKPTDEDRQQASAPNVDKMWRFVEKFAEKSGSYLHPQREVTEFLVIGLAKHIDEVGGLSVPATSTRTRRRRRSPASGSAPVRRCRSTSTATECSSAIRKVFR